MNISVIIPIYNVEAYVRKCLENPIAFHVLHHDHNKGLSATRNTGIRAAKGYKCIQGSEMPIPAISQIKRKEYPSKVAQYANDLLLVGINYDKEQKKHTCLIERCH